MRLGSKLPEIRAFETPSSTEQSPNTSNTFFCQIYMSQSQVYGIKKFKL